VNSIEAFVHHQQRTRPVQSDVKLSVVGILCVLDAERLDDVSDVRYVERKNQGSWHRPLRYSVLTDDRFRLKLPESCKLLPTFNIRSNPLRPNDRSRFVVSVLLSIVSNAADRSTWMISVFDLLSAAV
jgi:hypothetical protein